MSKCARGLAIACANDRQVHTYASIWVRVDRVFQWVAINYSAFVVARHLAVVEPAAHDPHRKTVLGN
jgi:hypothetical protein